VRVLPHAEHNGRQQTEGKTMTLMDLLMAAPKECVPTIQDAIRVALSGEYRLAARLVGYAADTRPEGDEWGDDAERVKYMLNTKAI
jgi:hypothetical protein